MTVDQNFLQLSLLESLEGSLKNHNYISILSLITTIELMRKDVKFDQEFLETIQKTKKVISSLGFNETILIQDAQMKSHINSTKEDFLIDPINGFCDIENGQTVIYESSGKKKCRVRDVLTKKFDKETEDLRRKFVKNAQKSEDKDELIREFDTVFASRQTKELRDYRDNIVKNGQDKNFMRMFNNLTDSFSKTSEEMTFDDNNKEKIKQLSKSMGTSEKFTETFLESMENRLDGWAFYIKHSYYLQIILSIIWNVIKICCCIYSYQTYLWQGTILSTITNYVLNESVNQFKSYYNLTESQIQLIKDYGVIALGVLIVKNMILYFSENDNLKKLIEYVSSTIKIGIDKLMPFLPLIIKFIQHFIQNGWSFILDFLVKLKDSLEIAIKNPGFVLDGITSGVANYFCRNAIVNILKTFGEMVANYIIYMIETICMKILQPFIKETWSKKVCGTIKVTLQDIKWILSKLLDYNSTYVQYFGQSPPPSYSVEDVEKEMNEIKTDFEEKNTFDKEKVKSLLNKLDAKNIGELSEESAKEWQKFLTRKVMKEFHADRNKDKDGVEVAQLIGEKLAIFKSIFRKSETE
jgi:hypothetical protein